MPFAKSLLPPMVPAVVLILLCEALVYFQIVPGYLLAAPSEVLQVLITERGPLGIAFLQTSGGAIAGLLLSTITGITAALLLIRYRSLERAITPYAIFFQTVPIVAIAPLLVIWFGYGETTVIASSWIVSFFPVLAATTIGLQSTDSQMMDLFKLYGASRWRTIFQLRLPWAIPQIFVGLRIAGGLAVIGAIVGEFVAGGGLGAMIDAARTQQRIDIVFAAVLLSTFAGFLVVIIVDFVKRRFRYGKQIE